MSPPVEPLPPPPPGPPGPPLRPPTSDVPRPPSPYVPPPPAAAQGPSESAGLATAALVCGLAGLVVFIFLAPSVVALVLGLIAARRARARPHPGDGRGRAIAGWILGIVGILGFVAVVITAIVVEEDDSSVRDDEVSVYDLEAGDCVNLPVDVEDAIEDLPVRDCAEPHDAEVYAIDDLTNDADDYPGMDAVANDTERTCAGDAFERYVGTDVASSRYGYYYLFPSEESWVQGDREYVCMVISIDGSTLTGSVQGSGD